MIDDEKYCICRDSICAPNYDCQVHFPEDEQLRARVEELEEFGRKVNTIRNSIIGMQGFNFSEHAYPLVAALEAAGFKGAGYPKARKNFGTLIEQRDRAEAQRDEARGRRRELEKSIHWAATTLQRWSRRGLIDKDGVDGMVFQLFSMLEGE